MLYPFDGYAVKLYIKVADGSKAGVCVGTMCFEFSPNYALSSYTFYSFTAKSLFSKQPAPYPDVRATSSDSNCVGFAGAYTGTGFDGCWNFNITDGTIGVDSTSLTVWQWLPISSARWTDGS